MAKARTLNQSLGGTATIVSRITGEHQELKVAAQQVHDELIAKAAGNDIKEKFVQIEMAKQACFFVRYGEF